ncbi:MAG: DUF4407 domain-containing protein [bacterium]|nr:DUF4407 domain-containing protein [bacterium]
MKEYIKSLILKPTLFSIVGSIILILGIPGGLYGLTLSGGASLGGVLILFAVLVTALVVATDRYFASIMKLRTLSLIELILAIAVILAYTHDNKKIILDLSDYQENYFVLILNEDDLQESKLAYSFPFNKSLTPNLKHGIIEMQLKDKYQIKMNGPETWTGYSMRPMKINGFSIWFYYTRSDDFDESMIKSLVLMELKSVAN